MKLHIENINITLSHPPTGLIATLALASASQVASEAASAPKIGEKWPGTEAIYAGVSLSMTGDSLVHLILWRDDPDEAMTYEAAVEYAEGVNREMGSHLPTRHQGIDLLDRLQDLFNKDYWHWTLTKTKSGKAAVGQHFYYGLQNTNNLSYEARVRAVSEIPL